MSNDPQLQKEIERFISLMPKGAVEKFVKSNSIDEILAPFASIIVDNAETLGFLMKKIGKVFEDEFGTNLDKKANTIPSRFFFKLNEGTEKLRKNSPWAYRILMVMLWGVDPFGASAETVLNIVTQLVMRKKFIDAIADAYDIVPTNRGNLLKYDARQDDDLELDSPEVIPSKTDTSKMFSTLRKEEIDRFRTLAGINKKVL